MPIDMVAVKAVVYTRSAVKALAKLPANRRERLIAKLKRDAETGEGDIKRLVGEDGARMRVGDDRIIFEESATAITVVALGHRRDIYR